MKNTAMLKALQWPQFIILDKNEANYSICVTAKTGNITKGIWKKI